MSLINIDIVRNRMRENGLTLFLHFCLYTFRLLSSNLHLVKNAFDRNSQLKHILTYRLRTKYLNLIGEEEKNIGRIVHSN